MKEGNYILTPNYSKIKSFLDQIQSVDEEQQAKDIISFLLPIKEEWIDYYQAVDPDDLFSRCYKIIVLSYRRLREVDVAIDYLQECIQIIEEAEEYQWKFAVKLELYYILATLYFEKEDKKKTKAALRKYVYYFFRQCCNVNYDKFEFYSFRPISNYLLESLYENSITLTDPIEFNDPLDPLLLQQFLYFINHSETRNDKLFYEYQREVFSKVRIRSLTRAIPLPKKEECEVLPLTANLKEVNYTYMWGYYANFHKGICIKYVFPKEFTETYHNEYVLSIQEVQYLLTYDPSKDTFNFAEAFAAKSDFWSHEHECRLVYFHSKNDEKFVSIPLPEGCMTELYLGLRTSQLDQWKIKQTLLKNDNIKIYQMSIDSTDLFLLTPIEIDRATWLNDYRPPISKQIEWWWLIFKQYFHKLINRIR